MSTSWCWAALCDSDSHPVSECHLCDGTKPAGPDRSGDSDQAISLALASRAACCLAISWSAGPAALASGAGPARSRRARVCAHAQQVQYDTACASGGACASGEACVVRVVGPKRQCPA
eukprot:203438-Chlamydomonas_euryale.AAC.5